MSATERSAAWWVQFYVLVLMLLVALAFVIGQIAELTSDRRARRRRRRRQGRR